MGQAKASKNEIAALKSLQTVVVMPIVDQKLYKGMTVGEYIALNEIKNAYITGDVICGAVTLHPVKTIFLITTNMKESEARSAVEAWWKLPENKGLKFAAWLPLNDIKNMTVSGLEQFGDGAQGSYLGNFLRETGLRDMYVAACAGDAELTKMFAAHGHTI